MRRERRETDVAVDALLARLGLADRSEELARTLPYGEQKRLEIARALASEPRLLLLDEPAAGMSVGEAADLMALVRGLREQGLTILLVEHHIRVVMQVSDRVAVLNHGELIAEGPPEAVRRDPAVIAAYLGVPA
jgi:branched-chain amino acid transport system ATP-binding protein